jgi:hypothetical protein
MSEIIVLGNLDDDNNEFYSSSRVYGGGGIAPTLGSCNFAKTKYTLVIERINEDEARKLKSKQ